MPKRLDPARARAAAEAGDPPKSARYHADADWHAAQDEWVAKWSMRQLPIGPRRRRQWNRRKDEHARLVATDVKRMRLERELTAQLADTNLDGSASHRADQRQRSKRTRDAPHVTVRSPSSQDAQVEANSGDEGLFDDVLAALQGSPAKERGAAAARARAEEAAVDVYECPVTRHGAAAADLVERRAERAVTRGRAAVIGYQPPPREAGPRPKDVQQKADVRQKAARLRPPAVPPWALASPQGPARLPPHGDGMLPPEVAPGGDDHCGGDFFLSGLVLLPVHGGREAAFGGEGRCPLFVMPAGAAVIFRGAKLAHGTTKHDDRAQRGEGEEAHLSLAVQTPGNLLKDAKAAKAIDATLEAAGNADADAEWCGEDVAWLPCYFNPTQPTPKLRLEYDPVIMYALPWRRVVLFDAQTGRPLVFYDAGGGLGIDEQRHVRENFNFVDDPGFQFNLYRTTGALALDEKTRQRMEMLGIHHLGCNVTKPPGKGEEVANLGAELDAYARHWKDPRFGESTMRKMCGAVERRMRALHPRASASLAAALRDAGVRDRLLHSRASDFVSADLLCANVGLSSWYASPLHRDTGDVGWTYAFAVKCCRSCLARTRSRGVRKRHAHGRY